MNREDNVKSVARIAFGIVWMIDALMKWTPAFRHEYLDILKETADGQPAWLQWWFQTWITVVSTNVSFFAYSTAVIETFIGMALILGFARKVTYFMAILFSLVIWSVAEGFGGPYTVGSTDVGGGIVYAIAALSLYALNRTTGTSRWSLDAWLEQRWTWWSRIAEASTQWHTFADPRRGSQHG